jgi:hypothetical protein
MRLPVIAVLVVGCGTQDPGPGMAVLSGPSGEQFAWAYRSDLGWTVELQPTFGIADPIPCNAARGTHGNEFSFTKAALVTPGTVPIVDTPQVATDPSVTFALGSQVFAPGNVTLTRVSGEISGTFTATENGTSVQVTGSLTDVPYCP